MIILKPLMMQHQLFKKVSRLLSLLFVISTASPAQPGVSVIDSKHYSHVFGEIRNFRIFLPPGYDTNPGKRYPVIYFLHGWSQRYFGSSRDRYAEYDSGNDNNGDNMENFVSHHDVIVVKSDGYNRGPGDDYYLRPYNIGPVETYRQFPVYFPELIEYIDGEYRTKPDRQHRAITGLSMGGFMAFMIGGKYPQLFTAVGNFCGSPEFFMGPKDLPVEYRHLDMYRNYDATRVRLNYGDQDFIRGYHQDLNRVWTRVMEHYEYRIYPGEHRTVGLGEMFQFLFDSFRKPALTPANWTHTDIYPAFEVWDYTVRTDRIIPGFTTLENTGKRGFRCSVREYLPDGALMPFVSVSITTASLYEPNHWYMVTDVDLQHAKVTRTMIRTDGTGRLQVRTTGGVHEIGINRKADLPNIVMTSYKIRNMDWPTAGRDVVMTVNLLNKGLQTGKMVTAVLETNESQVSIKKSASGLGSLAVNEMKSGREPFSFRILNDSLEIVRFKLTIRDGHKNKWTSYFVVPLREEVPDIMDFMIADGKTFTVAINGVDSTTMVIGHGNGDGRADAGETIEILVKEQGRNWRTQLRFSDSSKNLPGTINRKSENWGSFDNVGGSMKYSDLLLSSAHTAKGPAVLFAEYWLPDKPFHIIRKGKVMIDVGGNDTQPPLISWVKMPGDNVLQVSLRDGSSIRSVTATFTGESEHGPAVVLHDNGKEGDRVAGDGVFSRIIPRHDFGFYKITIDARDVAGNQCLQEMPGTFILH